MLKIERTHVRNELKKTAFRCACLSLAISVVVATPVWSNDKESVSSLCASEFASIRTNYPSARITSCEVVSPKHFELLNDPEDMPINPSPWYGFSVERNSDALDVPIRVTLRYAEGFEHRYPPKFSTNGVDWQSVEDSDIGVDERGVASIDIPLGHRFTLISAQEILGVLEYDKWVRSLQRAWRTLEIEVIGYSFDKRPIKAITTNVSAEKFVLVLGRQHPPEVTGGFALMDFIDYLADLRSNACDDIESSACSFFRTHSLVIVPLVNPDGVSRGYWRHNVGSTDLNRDWGPFTQPETRTVEDVVNSLVDQGKEISLMLDFHATNRNVLYTQTETDETTPPQFAARWHGYALANGLVEAVELAPRALSDLDTSKNYFFRRFGIAAITYEVSDKADRHAIAHNARVFADGVVTILGSYASSDQSSLPRPCSSLYCFMFEANKASLVMLYEQGFLDADLSRRIAAGIEHVDTEIDYGEWEPTANYLDLEAKLIENVGIEAANLHIGRSRQDLHGVARRMMVRHQLLNLIETAIEVRAHLLTRAERDIASVIPAYTHGVPSQPTTFGHQSLAFSESIARDIERYIQAFERMNRSQLGAAAGNTSGYRLDRGRLARLLGFDGPVVNAYDANFLSTADYKLDVANSVAQSAVTITQFIENIHSQQRNPRPWMYLTDNLTSGSSIMPQKRNPRPLDRLRSLATRSDRYGADTVVVDSQRRYGYARLPEDRFGFRVD